MAINTIALAEKITGELDQAISQKTATGFLADNALRAQFVGAGTVKLPRIELSGLGDYDHDDGFVQGAVTVAHQTCTLSMDRARSFQIDSEDYDETGIAGLAGQVMGEFVRTRVVPEVDAYVLSKLATFAKTKSQTVTGTLPNGVYALFQSMADKVHNAVGYDEELVAFVDSTVWTALQTSTEFSRQLIATDFRRGQLNTRVVAINGIPVLPVPDSRMKSLYVFNDGSTAGQTDGGFTPDDDAENIGLLMMPRRAASLVKKTEKARIFDPDNNQKADAWQFDYRLYYDLFIRKSHEGSVFVYLYSDEDDAGAGNGAGSGAGNGAGNGAGEGADNED